MNTSLRLFRMLGAVALGGTTLSALATTPYTFTMTPSATSYSAAGGTLTLTVNLGYDNAVPISALDLSVTTPSGWKYVSATGASVPQNAPQANDLGQGGLAFVYSAMPVSPASFSFIVSYPAGMTGNKVLTAIAANFTDELTSNVVTVSVSSITITPAPTAPAFSTQPTNQTATSGQNASFTAAATGFPAPALKWQKSADGVTNWTDLADGGRISGAATGTLTITGALSADALSYRAVATNSEGSVNSNAVTLTVNKASQTITFGTLTPVAFGASPFTLAATASSGLAVSYASSNPAVATVAGNTVTVVGAGSADITASQSGNSEFSAATSVTRTLSVSQAAQTITFNAPAAKTFGDAAFTFDATASSGLAVSYSSNTPTVATVTGTTIAIVGAGTSVITASQPGNTNFAAAASVQQTLTVNKANQAITFGALAQKTFDAAPFTLNATADSSLSVSYASSNPAVATVSGNTVTIHGVGSTTITASQAGNANYNAATPVDRNLDVVNAIQTITFAAIPARTFVPNDTFPLGATTTSGLTISYVSSNLAVATVSGATVTVVGAGTTTITASQAGDANFGPAVSVPQLLTVNKATATVTLGSLNPTYDNTPKSATVATTPSSLNVTFTYDGNATPPTNAGTYAVVATVNDTNYAGTASGSLVIAKAAQAITFGALSAVTFGDATFDLTATTTSPLTVAYTSSNPSVATVSGKTVTIVGGGTTIITASQAGDGNYLAATSLPQTLTVNKAAATVTLGSLSAVYSGSAKNATATTTPASLTVAFTYDGSATAPTNAGSYAVVGTIVSTNYQGSASGTLAVAKADQTITFGALASKPLDSGAFALTATADSGLAITYTTSSPSSGTVATISGSTVTLVNTGTITVTASQPGDGNHNAAASVPQVLTVLNQSQTLTFDQTQLPAQTFGASPFTISATSNRGLTVNFASSDTGVATVSASTVGGTGVSSATVTIVGAGNATITASQPGDSNTAAAADIVRSLSVAKATATVTLGGLAQTYDGTPRVVTATTVPVGRTVTFTYAGSGTAPTGAGSYAIVGTVNDPNYVGAASGTLVVAKASQAITFGALPVKVLGSGTFALTASASSGLAVSYASSNSAVATVSGSTVTLVGPGTTTITASQAGDPNFLPATNATQTLTVNAALVPTVTVASKALTATTAIVTPFTPVTAAGGITPYTFAISPTLPGNMSFNTSTGAVSGTPAAALTATTFTVTITDATNAFVSRTFILAVNDALSATQGVASKTLTVGTAAAAFRPVFPAGGTAPYTFAVSPTLPVNLTFSTSTGNVAGPPAAVATAATYTITITDNVGAIASNTFSLTVNGVVAATQAVATNILTVGAAAQTFTPVTASGGVPSYTFGISPTLPAGLSLNTSSGAITGTPALGTITTTYTMRVTDSAGGTATATFGLTVNAAPTSTLAIPSKALTVNTTATAFTPVTASGGTASLTYAVSPALPAGLLLNTSTGAITGTPTVTSAARNYTVTAADALGAATSKVFNLTVNPAVAANQAVASRTLTVGAAAAAFNPVNASGGTAPYTYSVAPALPAGVTLNTSTGVVSGTPTVVALAANYTVTVMDAAGATGSQAFSLTVNGAVTATQAIGAKVLTAGTAVATPFIPVTGAGGTAPYGFSIAPAVPAGLTLNTSNGAISGTPTGGLLATTFTVTVTDASNATASSTFSLTVNGPVVATPVIANKILTAGAAAVPFTPVTASGGTSPYTFAVAPALPGNLLLNTSTGAVSGTSTAPASSATYTVTISDSLGSSATGTFGLTVNAALAANAGTISSRTLTAGSLAIPFAPLPLTGGTPPYTWSITPTLSAGLSLAASTGVISGTPAASVGATTYTVTGTDGAGASVTQSLSLVINGALTTAQAVATKSLTATTLATAFTPVTAAGGTSPYTFVVTPVLPAGLTTDPATGAISGTPGVALSATTFTVAVTDAAGAISSKTFSLTVSGQLNATQVTPTKSLTATAAVVAFAPVVGAGGTTPYGYAISPSLPTGLTMSGTTGSITGTTAVALVATSFTVTVTDASTATATSTFTLTVNPALTSTQALASKVLTVGAPAVPFTPVTAADGTPPYTFTISPALPTALALDPLSGAIAGTPTAAQVAKAYTITVTDAAGATTTQTFGLTVNGVPTVVVAQAVLTKALTAGTAVTAFTPMPLTGGTPPFIYSVSPLLPAGLGLNAGTGAITGTASAAAAPAVYTITATDSAGAQVSQALALVVNAAPVATTAVPSQALSINVAATPFLPVAVAGGTPPFVYTISPALPTGLSISSSTGAISGTPTVVSNPVTYTVTATDFAGAIASAPFSLKVNQAPAITAQPTAAPTYLVNGTLTLTVAASGSPAPTYVWRKDGTPISGNTSATTATLTVTPLQLTDAGSYDVVVTNEVISVTSNAVVANVYLLPAIATPPAAQTIVAGGSATFSVVAAANPAPLSYQWRRGGSPFAVQPNGPSLTLSNVPLTGGGSIDVVVSNPGGSVTSTPATLTVNPVAPAFAPGLATTATAVQGRNFFFPVAINNTSATFSATGLGGPGGTLVLNSDGSLSGAPANLGTFSIVITATNTTASASFTLSLMVQPPPPIITSPASAAGRVGIAYTLSVGYTATATPASGVTFSATGLPSGLTIAGGGLVSGTPTAAGTFVGTLTATNATASVSQALVITIEASLVAPTFSSSTSLSGVQGTAFSFTPAFGGGPFTAPFTVTGLPAGITLTDATTGKISGTPTVMGTFTVNITATNAGGSTTVPFTLTINPAQSAPAISSASSPPAASTPRVGVPFSFQLTASGSPPATLYNATGLPAGLTLNAATGVISGTPTVFGSFDVTVSASNSVGTGATSIFTISISPSTSAPGITSAPVAPGQVDQPFNYTLTASNSPTSFQITSGTLPDGLVLNAATGAITGAPTSLALGTTRVWFNATDSVGIGFGPISGQSLEVLFTIDPAAATPTLNGSSTATVTAQVGQSFQYSISATSTAPITSYGATGLPGWLTLDTTTGVISAPAGVLGQPTTTPIVISLTASNGSGTGSPKTLLLTVVPAPATPTIGGAITAVGTVGVTFSPTYQIVASDAPTSYVALNLPNGLTLDGTTGIISGKPAVAGTFNVTLKAANANGLGAPSTLTINIAPAGSAPAIQSAASATFQGGVAFSYQITVRPTDGPILSYGLTGILPRGLTFNTATGELKGTSSDDPRTYSVQLTATNSAGTSAPQPLTLTLLPALGVPSLDATPLYATGQVGVSSGAGQDFPFTISATNLTGSKPYTPPNTIDAVSLPPGLAINPATGVIQGKPTAVGTTVATLVATNASGTSPTRSLTITILPALSAPSVLTDTSGAAGTVIGQVGQPFSYQIATSGTVTSYEIVGAPSWMSVNGATGLITGQPDKPGNFTVQLVVSNDAGSGNAVPLALSIAAAANAPRLTSSQTPPAGTNGTAFSFPVTFASVVPVPTFTTILATGLPNGMLVDPTVTIDPVTGEASGSISGTPHESGTFKVIISSVNNYATGAPVIITVTVNANVTFGP